MKMLSRLAAVGLGIAAFGLFTVALFLRPSIRGWTEPRHAPSADVRLSGDKARTWLQSDDGKSLAQALTAARFGLERQDSGTSDAKTGDEYLGVSHEQNLKAWFGAEGVKLHPTLPEAERSHAWSVALRLKSYGRGQHLVDAPPIVSRKVTGNRVEYQRALNQQLEIENRKLIEWYENREEGIEQGFTLNGPAIRNGDRDNDESLRLLLAVSGDLRAKMIDGGNQIELTDANGKGTLSYRKLLAQDADGKKLAARMEVSAEGREITLVVNDGGARYPIGIDPVIATLEQKLGSDLPQADARFGTTVAIDGNLAVVGAWREDVGPNADVGAVYVFVRSGSTWTLDKRFGPSSGGGQQCGLSVAVRGNRIAFGCPGENNGAGTAVAYQRNSPNNYTPLALTPVPAPHAGDQFGASIAISATRAFVGAPFYDTPSSTDVGAVFVFSIGANFAAGGFEKAFEGSFTSNAHYGASVAVDSGLGTSHKETFIVGAPGIAYAESWENFQGSSWSGTPLDGPAGTQFGQSVAISGNTAAVGAWADNQKAPFAGAAYVFTRDAQGFWTQQQKLLAFDGVANDFFSFSALALEGDTLVAGAYSWDETGDPNGDNDERGAAYVFTRNGTTWTQQTQILAADSNSGDNFGISVGLSGDTVIVGSRRATFGNTTSAGAAYVYRLPHNLANIATRLRVETGDNALIAGFIITGPGPTLKNVIIRALGPSLPLSDKLADPTLELYQGNIRLDANDNWVDNPASYKQIITANGLAPANDMESVIFAQLQANSTQYTAVVRGVNSGTGIGVVEVYDLGPAGKEKLANISTRGLVQTGDNVLFAGTIVTGAASQKVIIRGLGPSIPVVGRMSDPTLELHDGNGATLESNDNWVDSPNKQAIIDTGIPPNHDLESAIVRTLSPGSYTAILRGFGGTTGIAVVEVYALN